MDLATGESAMQSVALARVRYDATTGLVPVIVQEAKTREVLMMAYANREALKRTLATGQAWFFSRSRQEYWRKGATSGNTLNVLSIWVDCDADSLIYWVEAVGPACHTGERSCFYRTLVSDSVAEQADKLSGEVSIERSIEKQTDDSARKVLDNGTDFTLLADLWDTVISRQSEMPAGSYTTYLFTQGMDKIAKKVGEEAVEVALAAKSSDAVRQREEVAAESADLLYHLLVLWSASGVSPADVMAVLRSR
ncbi:bifunctional phosphoribosyl-AMP cyclohydrolase/phosphoribosyl-ATP diphosphatase HisIE [Alicyclobacillus tolerans]|uniref:Histidine biosynthesis bifunctional protein HisIE n=1 Tax=Alicyclobacillus tolerans TaxID=90970 RepID=A0ABT9LTQ0_9BACL|nr:bifunctional phosphoribosyl-AMP cyclohydrolase/phosphoribosyl-ATP diphosphatase HisIE [Alicyclobacillus tengchongensis]MDP9727636.1 phosphoribosyl-ATP pyrophosphohydrolase/phosphoribosyl-AMP cyclohydrolase [Alicyclobacillus tengchongensis]